MRTDTRSEKSRCFDQVVLLLHHKLQGLDVEEEFQNTLHQLQALIDLGKKEYAGKPDLLRLIDIQRSWANNFTENSLDVFADALQTEDVLLHATTSSWLGSAIDRIRTFFGGQSERQGAALTRALSFWLADSPGAQVVEYGSTKRGTANEQSDIDIFVLVSKEQLPLLIQPKELTNLLTLLNAQLSHVGCRIFLNEEWRYLSIHQVYELSVKIVCGSTAREAHISISDDSLRLDYAMRFTQNSSSWLKSQNSGRLRRYKSDVLLLKNAFTRFGLYGSSNTMFINGAFIEALLQTQTLESWLGVVQKLCIPYTREGVEQFKQQLTQSVGILMERVFRETNKFIDTSDERLIRFILALDALYHKNSDAFDIRAVAHMFRNYSVYEIRTHGTKNLHFVREAIKTSLDSSKNNFIIFQSDPNSLTKIFVLIPSGAFVYSYPHIPRAPDAQSYLNALASRRLDAKTAALQVHTKADEEFYRYHWTKICAELYELSHQHVIIR